MYAYTHHYHFRFLVNHVSVFTLLAPTCAIYRVKPVLVLLASSCVIYKTRIVLTLLAATWAIYKVRPVTFSLCHLQNKNRSYFACRYLSHLQSKTSYLFLNIICPCLYSVSSYLCHLQSKVNPCFACLSLCHLQNKDCSYFVCYYLSHLQSKTSCLSFIIICP